MAGSCQWSLVNEILQISRRPSAVCAAPLAQTCSAQLPCATHRAAPRSLRSPDRADLFCAGWSDPSRRPIAPAAVWIAQASLAQI